MVGLGFLELAPSSLKHVTLAQRSAQCPTRNTESTTIPQPWGFLSALKVSQQGVGAAQREPASQEAVWGLFPPGSIVEGRKCIVAKENQGHDQDEGADKHCSEG